jgi:hypothetical protein
MHDFHVNLLRVSAVGVGASRTRTLGIVLQERRRSLAKMGVIEARPSQTNQRALPHHRGTDFSADDAAPYRVQRSTKSSIKGGRPRAGVERNRGETPGVQAVAVRVLMMSGSLMMPELFGTPSRVPM